MRPEPPISLADVRARRLVQRLLEVQERLETTAAEPESADLLFEELERVLRELSRSAEHVRSARFRAAIQRSCTAHERWWEAVATSSERAAVLRYLRSVDALARAAEAASPRRR